MRKLLITMWLFSLYFPGFISGQQKYILGFKANWGSSPLKFTGDIAPPADESPLLNANTIYPGFQYRIGNRFGIGFYFFDQVYKWKFTDKLDVSLNNGEYIKSQVQSVAQIQGISGNIQFYFPFKKTDKMEWIFSLAYNYGKIKPTNKITEFSDFENQISISQHKYKTGFSSISFEGGLGLQLTSHFTFELKLGYSYTFDSLYTCEYRLQTNQVAGLTTIQSKSGNVYFGASLSYTLFSLNKKEKKRHFIPEYNENNEIVAINKRTVNTSKTIHVKANQVRIELSDYGKEDGDKISLFINDLQLLKKYKLSHKKEQIPIKLKPGLNKLIVFAHNLGKDPPNTASISIFDGEEKYVLSLESTLGVCGAIEIYCEE